MLAPIKRRRGAAVVETAIALPLLFLLILGTVEICNGIFMKQALKLMAFEGARVAIIPDASLEDVTQQVNELADTRNIEIESVEVKPADFESHPAGTFIEVIVTSSASQPGTTQLFSNHERTISVHIMKEHD